MKRTSWYSPLFTVAVIGCGDVVRQRVRPALARLGRELSGFRVMYMDVHPKPPFSLVHSTELREYYLPLSDNLVPVDELDDRGFVGQHVLGLVEAPTRLHYIYASQLHELVARLAIDKPLTLYPSEAIALTSLERVFPFSHFLMKEKVTSMLSAKPFAVNTVRTFFLESGGTNGRAIDPAEEDLGYHQGALLCACFDGPINIERCRTAKYVRRVSEAPLPASTAARIEGVVHEAGRPIRFAIFVGKGMREQLQNIVFEHEHGNRTYSQESDSDPSRPYENVLRTLLLDRIPQLRMPKSRHRELVSFCSRARDIAEDMGEYEFGDTPDFMHSSNDSQS
jgi:hypothetical protein